MAIETQMIISSLIKLNVLIYGNETKYTNVILILR